MRRKPSVKARHGDEDTRSLRMEANDIPVWSLAYSESDVVLDRKPLSNRGVWLWGL
jgi:hypothetical protein